MMGKYLEKLRAVNRKGPGWELTLLTEGSEHTPGRPYVSNVSSLLGQPQENEPDVVGDLRERFEERSGVMEYDGHLLRHDAEHAALACMPVHIHWPPLPNGDLAGVALDAAWTRFWNLVEGQLKGNAHAN